MPFLILGIIVLASGMFFHRKAKKHHDHEGEIGCTALIIAGIFLIVMHGIFYRFVSLAGV